MLGDKDAMATVAVKDLKSAKAFYEGKLGLKPAEVREEGALHYRAGKAVLMVYESRPKGVAALIEASRSHRSRALRINLGVGR